MNDKLTSHHLQRRAIVYVRQSSHQQIVRELGRVEGAPVPR